MSDKDDASKRPARPAVPPFLGPPGVQRIPTRPGAAPASRPAAPFVPPGLRAAPVAPPAQPAAPTPPAEPVAAEVLPPIEAFAPTPEPAPISEPASTSVAEPDLLPHERPTPVTGVPVVAEPEAPVDIIEGDEPPHGFAPPLEPPAEPVVDATSDEETPDEGPSVGYLHAPTGEYTAQSGSDLLAFPSVADFEDVEPVGREQPAAAAPSLDAPEPAEEPAAASAAGPGAETVSDAVDPGDAVEVPMWGGWPTASDELLAGLSPIDAGAQGAAPDVDETGLWEPDARDFEPVDEPAEDGGERPAAVPEPEPAPPAVEAAEQGTAAVSPEDSRSAGHAESEPVGGIAPEANPAELRAAGDEPDQLVRTVSDDLAGSDRDAGRDAGAPRPGGHPGPEAGYPAAAVPIYVPESSGDWEAAVARAPVPEAEARARLAELLVAVAQRVRAGQLAVSGLDGVESEEAALAAVLASLLAVRR